MIILADHWTQSFNYAGPDGKAAGQATDVVNGILTRLNQNTVIEFLQWSEGYNLAHAGPCVALYSTGRTYQREKLFKWVGPVASFEYMFYAKNGTGLQINSLEAAKKVGRIGVVKDDARHQFLLENRFDNIASCKSDAECLRSLMAGSTDLWLGSSANAADIARNEGIDPSAFLAIYPVRTVDMYIAFSPDTPDSVIKNWQDALDAMKRDGTFDAIRKKYGFTPAPATAVPASAGALADLSLNTMITETNGQLKVILRTFEVITITSDVQSGKWQTIRPLLATLEANEPDARTWYALPDGSYYTVVDGLTSANLKSRSYFPVVLAGNESIGTVVVSHSTGKNAGIIAVPVKNQGTVIGVIRASVYLDTLTDMLRQEIPESFVFFAIDSEGKFALHSDKGQISRDISTIGADTSFGQAIATMRTLDSGTVVYEDRGVSYMARFRSSPLTGWWFVVAWPETGSTTAAP
ncbi:MAG: transporter substrate-binding domain-containing protein [Methanoregula sp.]|nr:transporter substrate-binding domain-containing protein [Methanoregula sp.]